jgi:hypothetical protein
MNRLILLLIACLALIGGLFFLFQEDFKSTTSSSNSSNILFTEVEVNLNCPIDVTVINNLIEIYINNSCPRITIKRLDLKSKSQVTIQPQISWLNNFRASLFPLTKDDLEADMELFKSTAITEELTLLLNTPRSIDAKCDYSNVLANYTFKDIHMPYNNLTCYVNRAVAEGKNKVVFKVLSCPSIRKEVPKKIERSVIKENQNQNVPEKVKSAKKGDEKKYPSKIVFNYVGGSNTIQWDKSAVSNSSNKTFEFEFQYQRGGKWIKSGKIQFAVSDIGKKVISTQEILNAGGQDFVNHCHNKSCQLTIFERGKEYQKIQVSNIDCNDFHK